MVWVSSMVQEAVKQQVLEKINGQKDEMIKYLQDLVKIPSVTGQEQEAQQFIEKKFREMGLETDMFEPEVEALRNHPAFFETTSFTKLGYKDRPNVVGRLKGSGGGKSLILCGHIDVVSIEPREMWTHDPWGGPIENGKMYGRGAADMKAGIAAMIYAVQCLQEVGIKLKGDVILETVIEEEDGGIGGALATLLRGYTADAAIITEPYGDFIGIANAGVLYFRVKVLGRTAHAEHAHRGVNAISKAMKLYKALMLLNERRQKQIHYPLVENSAPDMKGHATILNIGVIKGGDWPSTVAGWAELKCRIGWPPGETLEDVKTQIEETVRSVAEEDSWLRAHPPVLEWIGWKGEASEQDRTHPFVQLIKRNAEEIKGKLVGYSGGNAGNDTRFYRLYGTPTIALGPQGMDYHGIDEYVELNSISETTKILALTMLNWCGYEE